MNKCDYLDKCIDLLKDEKTYIKLSNNPTVTYCKNLSKTLDKYWMDGTITTTLKHKLTPPTEPSIPAFYRLPKIHKPEPIPVCPIVSSVNSITYNVAKDVACVLVPLVGKTIHHTRNIQDFVCKIRGVNLKSGESITSYNVCALFTYIPPADAVEVV